MHWIRARAKRSLQSLSFFATTNHDIFTATASLRERLECTACQATKLAVELGLVSEGLHQQHTLLTPLREPMREFIAALSDTPDGA